LLLHHFLPAVDEERLGSIEWPDFQYASQYAITSIITRTKRDCSEVHREEVGRDQYDAGTLLFETDQLLRRHPELDLGQWIALPPAVCCAEKVIIAALFRDGIAGGSRRWGPSHRLADLLSDLPSWTPYARLRRTRRSHI
jgi:hypothetical protein